MKFISKSVVTLLSLATLGSIVNPVYASSSKIDYNHMKVRTAVDSKNSSNTFLNNDAKKYLKEDPAKGPGLFDSRVSTPAAIPFDMYGVSLYSAISHQAFLNQIKPYCLAMKSKGLLPSVAAAQTILESGWGNSTLATMYNNYFGVTGAYDGHAVNMPTKEFNNGQYHRVNRYFRAYPSMAASFDDYANILLSYGNIKGVTDYHVAARRLARYATAPTYSQDIISTIDAYGLSSWDKEAAGVTQESEKIAEIVYTPGYGILGWTGTGKGIVGSNYTFKNGTKWKTFGSKIINGQEMYLVGHNEYIPKCYTDHYDSGVVTIHYVPNYGVNAWHADGTQALGTNKIFKTGTRWKIEAVKEIRGQICYLVGKDLYIPKQYTQWGAGK